MAGRSAHSPRACVSAFALAMALLFALDGLLFRTPLYRSILQPDSSTGIFELILRREREAQEANGDNLVVTLGDSRFAYSPKLSNEIAGRTGLIFRHAGIGGSEARTWYYMLRELDPSHRRYRAVVIGVPNLSDEDEPYDAADDIRALHYVVERVRWNEILDFAGSFRSAPLRWTALRGSLLRGIVLQQDIHEFLTDPPARLKYVALTARGYEGWTYNYQEQTTSMAGLRVDWYRGAMTLPANANEEQRNTLQSELAKVKAPHTGRMAAYRSRWFGRIAGLYRGSPTKVIFVRLPRGPVPRPDALATPAGSTIRALAASQSNVLAAPEHVFDSLEQPELFKDGIHLNRAGIARFSPMVAEEVASLLAPVTLHAF